MGDESEIEYASRAPQKLIFIQQMGKLCAGA